MKNQEDIIKIFTERKPKTFNAITKLGLELDCIGIGLYRKVYRIVGHSFVVKIPNDKAGVVHAQQEYQAWNEIRTNRKYRVLWKYMPDITYFDAKKGISLMAYYEPVDIGSKKSRRLGLALSAVICDLFRIQWKKGVGSIDLHDGNIGLTQHGEPILIDLGYLYGPPEDDDQTNKKN